MKETLPTKNTESAKVNLSRKQVWGLLELPREDVERGKEPEKLCRGECFPGKGQNEKVPTSVSYL